MDDILEGRNDGGKITAPILFKDVQSTENWQPTVEEMQGFEKVLVFVTGKVQDGTSNIRIREIVLTEDNDYTVSVDIPSGEFIETNVDPTRIRYSVIPEGITITKADALITPGTYRTVFALVNEGNIVGGEVIPGWAEVFRVTIIVIVPLSVRHGNTTARHGETLVVNLTAPDFSPQYINVFGSRPWVLDGVETAIIAASPTSGDGFPNTWDSTWVMIERSNNSEVNGIITTTFRVLAETQWVDIIVNIPPTPSQISGRFVDPLEEEEGATGTDDIYIYI